MKFRWTEFSILSVFVFLCLLQGAMTSSAYGNAKRFKFTNNKGALATDLHIWFDRTRPPVTFPPNPDDPGTPIQNPKGTFKEASGSGTWRVNLAKGIDGGTGVANGNSLILTFDFPGPGVPTVRCARWTQGGDGTIESNPRLWPKGVKWLGKELKKKKNKNEWVMVPATGDGHIAVTIDGITYDFFSTAGASAAATAAAFAGFINGIPLGTVLAFSENSVTYAAEVYGIDDPITVEVITQDSTQPVTITTLPAEGCIPSLTLWGLILFILAVTGILGYMIMRRRRAVVSAR
jgi:hypothetical protein